MEVKITGGTAGPTGELGFIRIPVYRWQFRYFKGDSVIHMREHAPNFLHRFMQRLILGFYWERIK